MNKTSTKTLITLLIVLISFIFIVEFTSPIQSINIGHLQKRQDPAPSPDNPPPKDNPPSPDNPPPKDNPSPPPKDNPSPPPKENPPQESPPPPKDNPSPAPQPAPDTTPNPNPTPAPDPNATPSPSSSPPAPDPNATPTPDPNATPAPSSSPSPPAPNPNVTSTPVPNAPTTNPTTTVVSDTTSNTVSPIIDSPVVTSPNGTTNAGPSSSPITGISSVSTSVSTTSYLPGREPCTKADDPRCGRGTTDPTVVSTTEENEIITQPSTTAAAPTKSQSQLAPNPKKSTITQFTTYTTTSTLYFPGYSTVTSSKGSDGELTTYATYIPPSTVVVVKKVTSAKVEEIQETNPSSAGHLDLELSVYNLYSVATSLSVIAVTMLYLIVA